VNVKVTFNDTVKITSLEQTIDYEVLLKCIQDHMSKPTPLMESLVQEIETDIHNRFPQITSFWISMRKENPPMSGVVQGSEVILEKKYS
jgi:dihydroneopterin aldolase